MIIRLQEPRQKCLDPDIILFYHFDLIENINFPNTETLQRFVLEIQKRLDLIIKIKSKFLLILSKIPRPIQYNQNSLINGQGVIFNSKFRSNLGKTICGKFPVSKKNLMSNRINYNVGPGPGEYRVFSEFGIYESKNVLTEENRNHTIQSSYKNSTVKTTGNI